MRRHVPEDSNRPSHVGESLRCKTVIRFLTKLEEAIEESEVKGTV
jgi:hypothetical protein